MSITTPPPTPVREVVETIHGVRVRDPYRWLEAGDDAAVRAWVADQNAHTRAVLDALPERDAIAAGIARAMEVGALGESAPRGRRRFFTRRSAGMDQPALYLAEGQAPRRLVDPGAMAADGTTALDWWIPSDDGELVCFGLSQAGDEESTLHLLRTATRQWLADRIPRCRWSAVAFEPGNAAILYTREPRPGTVPAGEEGYHRHVWRHVIGADPAHDVEIFGPGRDKLDVPVGISISRDGHWTVITVARGWTSTDVYVRGGSADFRPIIEGTAAKLLTWFADNRLLGITNLGAPLFRLVEIDPADPAPQRWGDVVPESENVLVRAVATAGGLAVEHLVEASSHISMHSPDGRFLRALELPQLCTVTGLGGHPSSPDLYVTVEQFTRPAVTLRAGAGEVDRLEPPLGFDPDRHPVRQVRYSSRDGTRVPMFLVGRSVGAGPAVLTGYGGFSVSRTPLWMAAAVPFLAAGGLLAVACLRGGAEFGEPWHEAGMRERKQNVFDDFIAAAEWLVEAGLTTPRQLGIIGGSNGGLLVGAAMTQRPELFGAVVCRVPLLDMVRYERFKIAELWKSELGSAASAEEFGWLYAYSPYHRVEDGVRYPPVLITTGEEDSRVDPMHARKMAARLQAANPSGLTLLRAEPRAGHGQGKPVWKLVPEEADVWAFLLHVLGG